MGRFDAADASNEQVSAGSCPLLPEVRPAGRLSRSARGALDGLSRAGAATAPVAALARGRRRRGPAVGPGVALRAASALRRSSGACASVRPREPPTRATVGCPRANRRHRRRTGSRARPTTCCAGDARSRRGPRPSSALQAGPGALGARQHAGGVPGDVERGVELARRSSRSPAGPGTPRSERLVDQRPARQVVPVDERDRDAGGAGPGGAADRGAGRSSRPRGTGS